MSSSAAAVLLVFGFLSDTGTTMKSPYMPTYFMESQSLCEQTAHSNVLRDSYLPMLQKYHPGKEIRIWCEPIAKRD